ncbi:MAG: hypothetical protein ACTHU0_17540 [Kofleriaceae bacterium]
MKKLMIVAFVVASVFTACGGKKKADNTTPPAGSATEPAPAEAGSDATEPAPAEGAEPAPAQ